MTQDILDGCVAAAHIAYGCSECAFIYPITPSSSISEVVDSWMSKSKKNIFDQVVSVVEMQSEMGSAGALHGSLCVGSTSTTFTASQGLLLMIPNMYKIAGELWPCVFHVTARALATSSLSIFGDHNDIMATRQTGCVFLHSLTVQEVMDLSLVAHISTLNSSVPFVHFFDGFRISHELQKIEVIDYEIIKKVYPYDKLEKFKSRALSPLNPIQRGTATSSDVYFQSVEARNKYYDAIPNIVQEAMDLLSTHTGRRYKLFDYFGSEDAKYLFVVMGAGSQTIEELVKHLIFNNEKVGMIKVRLFRPWSVDHFIECIPVSVEKITVLERCKESGSIGEPLYLDVCSSIMKLYQKKMKDKLGFQFIQIVGGRYGLASKEFTPAMALSVWENMISESPIENFTVGITDDVTFKSLPIKNSRLEFITDDTKQCLFWGFGSDGTVSANKNAIKVIGESTDMFVQGYFVYDAKKAGGATMSHLRFGPKEINSPYLLQNADFIAVHHPSYIHKFDVLEKIKKGGVFVLNCPWSTYEDINIKFPDYLKYMIATNDVKLYVVDAQEVSNKANLGRRINNVLMTVFFKLADIIPFDLAIKLIKDAIEKSYGKKGEAVVKANCKAVDLALESLKTIEYDKQAWSQNFVEFPYNANVSNTNTNKTNKFNDKMIDETVTKNSGIDSNSHPKLDKFVDNVLMVVNSLKGDDLPVSAFDPSGVVPLGTTAFEKRGIAISIPIVDMNKCTQCNYCSIVCPHAAIRPFLLNSEEYENAPKSMHIVKAKGGTEYSSYYYRIQVSSLDCTGCELCVHACPDDALRMEPFNETEEIESINWNYLSKLPNYGYLFDKTTIRGSQFQKPLLEFSAACEGCGETPYIKLITQLFGERMVIANATGCSSIWGASFPSVPYTVSDKGYGPAWGNSLFEDNAEYGLGMVIGYGQRRDKFRKLVEELFRLKEEMIETYDINIKSEWTKLKDLFRVWLKNSKNSDICQDLHERINNSLNSNLISGKLDVILDEEMLSLLYRIYDGKDLLLKISHWIVGGDGWAYDIGYAGLDHVLAQGLDLNIIILDTEVYSNTGGQASKSTPLGAVAKFAQGGNMRPKKDIGLIAMEYGTIYVASIALGANFQQSIKSLVEAENYSGTSLIIAYSTCIEHGYTKYVLQQESVKLAVESGYWPLYRFNPALVNYDENEYNSGLILDSKKLKADIQDFVNRENRFLQLIRSNPKMAGIAVGKLKIQSDKRFLKLKNMSDNVCIDSLKSKLKYLKDQLAIAQKGGALNLDIKQEIVVNILYASETGNTEDVAYYVQTQFKQRDIISNIYNMSDVDLDELIDPSIFSSVLVITSTSGQGEFPGGSKELYESLEKCIKEVGVNDGVLSHMSYSIFGLGDSAYVYFNEAAYKWNDLLTRCGAKRLGEIGLGDDQDEDKYETKLMEWLPEYFKNINAPEPKMSMDPPDKTVFTVSKIDNKRKDFLDPETKILSSTDNSEVPFESITPTGSVLLPLMENYRITSPGYDKDVRHLVFDLSNLGNTQFRYNLGDSLAIYYENDIIETKKVCNYFGFDCDQIIEISLTDEKMKISKKYEAFIGKKMTILQFLVQGMDLFGQPNKRFFQCFYQYCNDNNEKNDAKRWAMTEGIDLIKEFQNETKTYMDMFYMYNSSSKISLNQLMDLIPVVKPRYYSIASSSKMVNNKYLELCVGIVDWKTSNNVLRYGQCTGFINRLPQNKNSYINTSDIYKENILDTVGKSVYLSSYPKLICSIKGSAFNLPDDETLPIIIVCMGTGIAPFRAFLQYKALVKTVLKKEIGPVIIYFGCRYYNKDYLYCEELEQYVEDGVIHSLNVAFSRDSKKDRIASYSNINYNQKVYVQNLIVDTSDMFYQNLFVKSGYFYLCGTKQIPLDIRKSVIEVIVKETGYDHQKANQILNKVQVEGRYNVEAW